LSRRLKDVVFVKEMRDAMASGEFAVSLSGAQQLALIDYQNLCNKLHNFACKLEQDEIETDVLSPLERAKNLAQLSKICDQLEEYILKMAKTDWQSKGASSSGNAKSGGLPDPRRLFWYVRDDQTVDLDGAFSDPGKAARFSRDLWERLNGQSHGGEPKTPPSDSPRAAARAVALKAAKDAAANAEEARQRFLAKAADQLGPKRSSLEAPPAPGADELRELRSELRGYEEEVRNRRSLVSLRTIEWLLQRSADELERDLLGTNMSEWAVAGPQLKLLVAEFSLMEKQVTSYQESSLEHAEELSVLEGDANDFAQRLGLQGEEREARDFLSSSRRMLAQMQRAFDRARSGLDFYMTGAQLLWQDLQYASSLLGKAFFSNYTLRALEVRTLQRTVKDVLTLIPFLIILIIPLSPVGHVLVFSFIQKNFPEFFPSAFTEHRQNAIKIYRDIVTDAAGGKQDAAKSNS